MALHRQPMGAGQSGGPSTDHGNGLASIGGTFEILVAVPHCMIGGMTLQQPDLDGLALGLLADAGLLAKRFRGADTGAHSTKDVLFENGPRRTVQIACRDLPNELRNINRRRTGRHAGRVVTEIAPVGSHHGFMAVERRIGVGKILLIGIIIKPAFDDSVFEIPVDHAFLRSQQGEQSGPWLSSALNAHMSASASRQSGMHHHRLQQLIKRMPDKTALSNIFYQMIKFLPHTACRRFRQRRLFDIMKSDISSGKREPLDEANS